MRPATIILLLLIVTAVVISIIISSKEKAVRDASKDAEKYRPDNLVETLRETINNRLNEDLTRLNISRKEMTKREEQRNLLKKNTRECSFGDSGKKEFVKLYLKDLLQKTCGINEWTICFSIPFNDANAMTPQDKFEYMYTMFRNRYPVGTFGAMVRYYKWGEISEDESKAVEYKITNEDIEKAYAKCPYTGTFNNMLDTLTQRIYQKMYGHDVTDIFISDTSVNGVSGGTGGLTSQKFDYLADINNEKEPEQLRAAYESIWVVQGGKRFSIEFLSYGSNATLERVVKNIYRWNARTALSQRTPYIVSSFVDNSRVVVARPPFSASYCFFVRKFDAIEADHLENLFKDNNSTALINMLKGLARTSFNFVISGDPGAGKTTTLKAVAAEINPLYNIRVAETAFETSMNNIMTHRNIVVLQEREGYSIYDAIVATKKMDTDVIIVGEVNEPKLAGAFIQTTQTGSKQGITTLHHRTTQALIDEFRNALVTECGISDVRIAEKQVIDCIDFDVHQVRDEKGHFYIERITEIIPKKHTEYSDDVDKATVQYYSRLTDPQYELHDIIKYNKSTKSYEVCCLPDENRVEALKNVLSEEEFDSIFGGLQ